MTKELTIECPKCNHVFSADEALQKHLKNKQEQITKQLKEQEKKISQKIRADFEKNAGEHLDFFIPKLLQFFCFIPSSITQINLIISLRLNKS